MILFCQFVPIFVLKSFAIVNGPENLFYISPEWLQLDMEIVPTLSLIKQKKKTVQQILNNNNYRV